MDRFALLTARNKYLMPGNDLRGCVNDVEAVFHLLADVYGFPPDHITVLTDERATTEAIYDEMNRLVSHPNAELCFYNSSHGSQIRDLNGDELDDKMDEVLIPYDLDPEWTKLVIDDDIGMIVDKMPGSSFLTLMSDSCHSGTFARDLKPGVRNHPGQVARYLPPPIDFTLRATPTHRHPDRHHKLGRRKFGHAALQRAIRDGGKVNWIAFSGCLDNQTSAECTLGSQIRGAWTFSAENTLKSKAERSNLEVQAAVNDALAQEGFDQRSELTGVTEMLNRPFLGGPA